MSDISGPPTSKKKIPDITDRSEVCASWQVRCIADRSGVCPLTGKMYNWQVRCVYPLTLTGQMYIRQVRCVYPLTGQVCVPWQVRCIAGGSDVSPDLTCQLYIWPVRGHTHLCPWQVRYSAVLYTVLMFDPYRPVIWCSWSSVADGYDMYQQTIESLWCSSPYVPLGTLEHI